MLFGSTSTWADVSALVLHSPKHVPLDIPTGHIYCVLMYTTEKSRSTQVKLEDVLQDSLPHSTCWQPCSPVKQIRASRRKKPSSPSIARTGGVLMLLLYRPASLVPPYLVKQTLPATWGRNFVCICARGSVCTPAHNTKIWNILFLSFFITSYTAKETV